MQVLFALNARYVINEKGSMEAADALPLRPEDFGEIVETVLARPGESPGQLSRSVRRLEELSAAVVRLCAGSSREAGGSA